MCENEKLDKKHSHFFHQYILACFCFRFDEVDEANPEKKPTIHEILLKGKRGNRLPFEDELMPPRGNEKLTNNFRI
jgi:hypothetical protein